jgi:hypothetical protein
MKENRSKAGGVGGEFMIQDSDHLKNAGQMGGKANQDGRQSEQSHSTARQQGTSHRSGAGQQGGERSHRRSK